MNAGMTALSMNGVHCPAKVWRVAVADGGLVVRLTDHDKVLVVDGETYSPAGAAGASAYEGREGPEAANRDLAGALTSGTVTEADLLGGRYRGAVVRERIVDWRFPFGGWWRQAYYTIDDVKFDGEVWRATVTSARSRLGRTVGETYSRLCRWRRFGDADCTVDPSAYAVTGRFVVAVSSSLVRFTCDVSSSVAGDHLQDALVDWTSGANAGRQSQVKRWSPDVQLLEIYAPPRAAIAVAAGFTITPNCNRTEERCKFFGNIINFGGKPDIPGTDSIILTPSQ